jgi:TPR repeat protein
MSGRMIVTTQNLSILPVAKLLDLLRETKSQDALEIACLQNELARRYHFGEGEVDIDLQKAAQYAERAAENGLAAAQFNFAGMLFSGVGTSRDPIRSAGWYKRLDLWYRFDIMQLCNH